MVAGVVATHARLDAIAEQQLELHGGHRIVPAVGCDLVRGVVGPALTGDLLLADQLVSQNEGQPDEDEQGVRIVPVQH